MSDRMKFALKGLATSFVPVTSGMGFAVVMTCVATNPTWKTWLCWALGYAGIGLLCFSLHYWMWMWKKR